MLVWEGPAALRAAGVHVGAGQWCDKVDPVVVSYHTGGKNRSSSGLPQEMTRQLDGQFTALSLMSAKEILAGMATFDERRRSPASHTRSRKDFQDKLAKSLERRHHFPPEVAGLWASRAMKELAVLHNLVRRVLPWWGVWWLWGTGRRTRRWGRRRLRVLGS